MQKLVALKIIFCRFIEVICWVHQVKGARVYPQHFCINMPWIVTERQVVACPRQQPCPHLPCLHQVVWRFQQIIMRMAPIFLQETSTQGHHPEEHRFIVAETYYQRKSKQMGSLNWYNARQHLLWEVKNLHTQWSPMILRPKINMANAITCQRLMTSQLFSLVKNLDFYVNKSSSVLTLSIKTYRNLSIWHVNINYLF